MKRERPTSVLVIAILQFVFGGLGLFCLSCVGVFEAAGGNKMFTPQPQVQGQAKQPVDVANEMEEFVQKKHPHYTAEKYADIGVGMLLSLLMIVSGFGLLRLAPWGRSLAIFYAFLSLIHSVVSVAYTLTFTLPAMREFVDMRRPNLKAEEQAMLDLGVNGNYVGVFLTVIFSVFPIVVLIIMFRGNVKAAFAGDSARSRPASVDDYADESWGQGDQP